VLVPLPRAVYHTRLPWCLSVCICVCVCVYVCLRVCVFAPRVPAHCVAYAVALVSLSLSLSLALCLSLSLYVCVCVSVYVCVCARASPACCPAYTGCRPYTVSLCLLVEGKVVFVLESVHQRSRGSGKQCACVCVCVSSSVGVLCVSEATSSCRSFFAKEPLFIGLFCGKRYFRVCLEQCLP